MNKKLLWGVACLLVLVFAMVGCSGNNNNAGLKAENAEDLLEIMNKVYEKTPEDSLPGIDTVEIDITDDYQFSRFTGLSSNEDVDALVVSMPFINAQAYEAALIKVKDGADVEAMKQEILDNINMNMWVCVSAEKLYVTNSGNVIFFVMGQEGWEETVFNAFKEYVGEDGMGKTLEKEQNFDDYDFDLPEDLLENPAVSNDDFIVDDGVDTENNEVVPDAYVEPLVD